MPLPERNKDESRENFISRCMSDNKVQKEYPDQQQRVAVCMSKASEGMSSMASADFQYNVEEFGYTEDITEDNFYIPAEAEYVDFNEDTEEWDVAVAKPGLWENIRKKKEREGKNYKPAKRGDKDRPDPEAWKKAQSLWKLTVAEYDEGQMQREQLMKMHHQLMEIEEYLEGVRFEDWTKDMISKAEIYIQNIYDFVEANKTEESYAAEYQGRKVSLNKPFRTPDGPKKFAVYTKNGSGKVVIVRFGDPNMEIKKDDPARRKSFRARHKCDTAPGPKWKARYWSCKKW
jgi:cytochrome c556